MTENADKEKGFFKWKESTNAWKVMGLTAS